MTAIIPVMGPVIGATTFSPAASPFGAGIDADALLWSDAVVANGGTVSANRLVVVSAFVAAEKASGAWALTDDYWGLWGENAPQALTSLKQRRLAVATNSPTLVADRGYTSDGATSYIATGFDFPTDAVVTTPANIRIAGYVRTNVGASLSIMGGLSSAATGVRLRPRAAGNFIAPQINSTLTNGTVTTITDSRGLTAVARNGSSGAVCSTYKNGVFVESYTPAGFSGSFAAQELYLLAINNLGTAGEFYTGQVSFATVGAALSAGQEATQYANVQAWATAIGAQV